MEYAVKWHSSSLSLTFIALNQQITKSTLSRLYEGSPTCTSLPPSLPWPKASFTLLSSSKCSTPPPPHVIGSSTPVSSLAPRGSLAVPQCKRKFVPVYRLPNFLFS